MPRYQVWRSSGTGEVPHDVIRIVSGEDYLWEGDAESYVQIDGQTVRLSDLPDEKIIDEYVKGNLKLNLKLTQYRIRLARVAGLRNRGADLLRCGELAKALNRVAITIEHHSDW